MTHGFSYNERLYFEIPEVVLLKNLSGSLDVKDISFRSNSNEVRMNFLSDRSGSDIGFKAHFFEGNFYLIA